MNRLELNFEISPELYLKDPSSSELGKKIVSASIEMIHLIGFEAFTFKKLGKMINSNESSIYRYFPSKHKLLIYLTSWYWSWTDFRIVFAINNIESSKDKLSRVIDILTRPVVVDNSISHVNEVLLSEIIFSESFKAFHTRNVDEENKKGCFKSYKNVIQRVSSIMLEVSPEYDYPHMLTSTIIEGAHQQKYFLDHFPKLSDLTNLEKITDFYKDLVFKTLDNVR
jgi:AcrR family transcriptional regulator